MIRFISVFFLLAYGVLGIALMVHHHELKLPRLFAYFLAFLYIIGILVLGYLILFLGMLGYNS